MLELLLDWFLGQSWDHISKDGTFKAILFKLTLQYYKMMLELCQAGAWTSVKEQSCLKTINPKSTMQSQDKPRWNVPCIKCSRSKTKDMAGFSSMEASRGRMDTNHSETRVAPKVFNTSGSNSFGHLIVLCLSILEIHVGTKVGPDHSDRQSGSDQLGSTQIIKKVINLRKLKLLPIWRLKFLSNNRPNQERLATLLLIVKPPFCIFSASSSRIKLPRDNLVPRFSVKGTFVHFPFSFQSLFVSYVFMKGALRRVIRWNI